MKRKKRERKNIKEERKRCKVKLQTKKRKCYGMKEET